MFTFFKSLKLLSSRPSHPAASLLRKLILLFSHCTDGVFTASTLVYSMTLRSSNHEDLVCFANIGGLVQGLNPDAGLGCFLGCFFCCKIGQSCIGGFYYCWFLLKMSISKTLGCLVDWLVGLCCTCVCKSKTACLVPTCHWSCGPPTNRPSNRPTTSFIITHSSHVSTFFWLDQMKHSYSWII